MVIGSILALLFSANEGGKYNTEVGPITTGTEEAIFQAYEPRNDHTVHDHFGHPRLLFKRHSVVRAEA